MDKEKYKKMINDMTPKENRLLNMIVAFFVGGFIGLIATFLFINFNKAYSEDLSMAFTLLSLIIVIAFLTSMNVADDMFSFCKCGLIVPITGFAHSIASSIIDYKKEGFINIGSNTFKLAGSVILYSIVASVTLALIKVVLNV